LRAELLSWSSVPANFTTTRHRPSSGRAKDVPYRCFAFTSTRLRPIRSNPVALVVEQQDRDRLVPDGWHELAARLELRTPLVDAKREIGRHARRLDVREVGVRVHAVVARRAGVARVRPREVHAPRRCQADRSLARTRVRRRVERRVLRGSSTRRRSRAAAPGSRSPRRRPRPRSAQCRPSFVQGGSASPVGVVADSVAG